jgi:hypothetical protein
MPGNVAAQMTAKMVMASAARLMLVRHFCLRRQRIALMSVPAWPIPIQNTKFVMSHAQSTWLFRPQTPTPVMARYRIISGMSAAIWLVRKKVGQNHLPGPFSA